MKILLTGFDPFGEDKINPSIELVKKVEGKISNAEIFKLEIPTVFKKSGKILEENIRKIRPDVILCIGQAGGRSSITVERIAINIDDARISDNLGEKPIDKKIRDDGDNAYFSNLPIKKIVEEIKKENIPAEVSNSAGTFVCNHLMYESLYLAKKYKNIRAGFIHIPYLPEQVINKANTPSMDLENSLKAINIAIKTIINYDGEDVKISGGKIS
ncbi:pyroglutamyl-peptidase I [Anaerococcus hydrogenalis DSM 7454]|uniref:Pyrrolidone-carboxylate peptidase n=1 Tax=Anaerococcus hydrogenalis DSM 7454 TaxID=561177 RepID=B6WAT6_9FIRM|nr:pyroglutamyl-peptidase I [Anaerococcus hydrogenalis]EEB35436.1 pyroglutamyl-peptidase I [Anaerococcus hydrogenalis DSM 7454]